MKQKFNAGEVVVRSANKHYRTPSMRDEQVIIALVSDGHPICPRMWYVCRSVADGRMTSGLQSVMEECFEIK